MKQNDNPYFDVYEPPTTDRTLLSTFSVGPPGSIPDEVPQTVDSDVKPSSFQSFWWNFQKGLFSDSNLMELALDHIGDEKQNQALQKQREDALTSALSNMPSNNRTFLNTTLPHFLGEITDPSLVVGGAGVGKLAEFGIAKLAPKIAEISASTAEEGISTFTKRAAVKGAQHALTGALTTIPYTAAQQYLTNTNPYVNNHIGLSNYLTNSLSGAAIGGFLSGFGSSIGYFAPKIKEAFPVFSKLSGNSRSKMQDIVNDARQKAGDSVKDNPFYQGNYPTASYNGDSMVNPEQFENTVNNINTNALDAHQANLSYANLQLNMDKNVGIELSAHSGLEQTKFEIQQAPEMLGTIDHIGRDMTDDIDRQHMSLNDSVKQMQADEPNINKIIHNTSLPHLIDFQNQYNEYVKRIQENANLAPGSDINLLKNINDQISAFAPKTGLINSLRKAINAPVSDNSSSDIMQITNAHTPSYELNNTAPIRQSVNRTGARALLNDEIAKERANNVQKLVNQNKPFNKTISNLTQRLENLNDSIDDVKLLATKRKLFSQPLQPQKIRLLHDQLVNDLTNSEDAMSQDFSKQRPIGLDANFDSERDSPFSLVNRTKNNDDIDREISDTKQMLNNEDVNDIDNELREIDNQEKKDVGLKKALKMFCNCLTSVSFDAEIAAQNLEGA